MKKLIQLLTTPFASPKIKGQTNPNSLLGLRRAQAGLTLIEILVVIVLISLIAVVVGKNVIGQGEAARAELNIVKMEKLKSLLGQYRLKFNSYPGKLNNLIKASPEVQKSGKLFIAVATKDDIEDVWGFPFVYKSENNGRSYTLTTLGSDGTSGGEGADQDVTMRP